MVLALAPTLAGHTLFAFGLRFLEAKVATILATIEPVMATLWAALFLGESLTWLQIVGGGLVIAGVIVSQKRNRHQTSRRKNGRKSHNCCQLKGKGGPHRP